MAEVQEIRLGRIIGDIEPGKTAELDIKSSISSLPLENLRVTSSNEKIAQVKWHGDDDGDPYQNVWTVSFLKEGTVSIKVESPDIVNEDGGLEYHAAIPVQRNIIVKQKDNFVLNSGSCPRKITSWKEMVNYIKVQLGAGVICVEISDEQINNSISESIAFVQRYLWGEGYSERAFPVDLKKGQTDYVIDADIISVVGILARGFFLSTDNFRWNDILNGIVFSNRGFSGRDGGQGIIANWETQMAYLKTLEEQFGKHYTGSFDSGSKTLRISPAPKQDMSVAIHCYVAEDCRAIFNNILFQKYATAVAGVKWARNLLKYSSVSLPGGANISASELNSTYTEQETYWRDKIIEEGRWSGISIG